MKLKFKIAFRNILRQRGRTAVSLMMIGGAVVGLVIFIGFSDHILSSMKDIAIDNESGHLQVGTKTFWNLKSESRKKQLLSNPAQLEQKITQAAGRALALEIDIFRSLADAVIQDRKCLSALAAAIAR